MTTSNRNANERRAHRYDLRTEIAGRLVAPVAPERHGQRSTYNNWGCRCEPCTDSNRHGQRAVRQASRRAEQGGLARLRAAYGRR